MQLPAVKKRAAAQSLSVSFQGGIHGVANVRLDLEKREKIVIATSGGKTIAHACSGKTRVSANLVPRGCVPFGQHQGSKTSGLINVKIQ